MPEMSMMQFLATEGGRKCPMCCRYARSEELGYLGARFDEPAAYSVATREPTHWRTVAIMDGYGHLPGFGCNKPTPAQQSAAPDQTK